MDSYGEAGGDAEECGAYFSWRPRNFSSRFCRSRERRSLNFLRPLTGRGFEIGLPASSQRM